MPEDARGRLLAEHERIRAALVATAQLAQQVCAGRSDRIGALRGEAERLLDGLREHMTIEGRLLEGALSDAVAEERALREQLGRDHAEQQLMLDHIVADVADPQRPPQLLAQELADFARCVLEDMDHEERLLLPRLGSGPPSGRSDSFCSA